MFMEDGFLSELLAERFNYCVYVALLLIGLVLLWWVDPEGNRSAAPVAEAAE